MTIHEAYMHRCLGLAKLGIGNVAPNPMVGAVLVQHDRIIGEGYHRKYGEPHAERNCIAAVKSEDERLIRESILYVSLEPCVHFGKTPPCTDLIIEKKIPTVIIGSRDPFKEVNGKGIEKLQRVGIKVQEGILEKECKELNKRFLTFHTHHRPYIILKWAQTANGKITGQEASRLYITNEFTNRIVHKWRSEEAAILVGTNTALLDNPELALRLWPGNNPTRLVVDMDLRLPSTLKIFDDAAKTIVFNKNLHDERKNVIFYQVTEDASVVHQITNALYQLKIQSVIVEGGARLLQSFIDENTWDEARIITNKKLVVSDGLRAPEFGLAVKLTDESIFSDHIEVFKHPANSYM